MDTLKNLFSGTKSTWLWPAVMLLAVFLGVQLIDGTFTRIVWGDSASYLLLAKSIATGHGLSDINIPGMPAHTQYPPGLPVMLAPVFYLLGFNFVWMRLIVIVAGLASIYMVKLFFEREGDKGLGVVLALMVVTNFYHLYLMRELLSEIPYAFLSLGALYCFRRYSDEPVKVRYPVMLVLAIAAAYLTRMIGITLYAAMAAALFLRLRPGIAGAAGEPGIAGDDRRARVRGLVFFLAAGIAPFVLWTLRNSLLAEGVTTYQSIFFQADYYSVDSGFLALSSLAARAVKNLGYYADALPMALITSKLLKNLLPSLALKVFSLIMLATVLLGFFYDLRSRRGVVELYFLFYFGLLIVWPVYGSGDARRYVVPMLPFVYYYLLRGTVVIAGLKGPGASSSGSGPAPGVGFKRVMLIPCIFFLVLNFMELRTLVRPVDAVGRVYSVVRTLPARLGERATELDPGSLELDVYAKTHPCYGYYLKAALYLKETMAPGELVMTRKPEIAALVTGGYAVRFPFTKDHDLMESFMEDLGVDYVLLDACRKEGRMYLAPFIEARNADFSLLRRDVGSTVVLRYRGGG